MKRQYSGAPIQASGRIAHNVACMRCTDELRENFEMWLLHAYRAVRCFAVFQHEKIAKKRLRTVEECTCPE